MASDANLIDVINALTEALAQQAGMLSKRGLKALLTLEPRGGYSKVSVWPPHLDDGVRTRRYRAGLTAPTKATHSTRLSAPSMRYFSASVRTPIRSCSSSQPYTKASR